MGTNACWTITSEASMTSELEASLNLTEECRYCTPTCRHRSLQCLQKQQ
ncbi:unnamed protein product [Musa acuminata subsp. malaccensis]|uniref:(wild Malaysian banana) hypothetical protein n=1 Tax=Musa acuminata subsp. malaccensis TaxID=214687 RepID=A0A804KCZ6_MUSAM|nr:unnamed protein product [Musa acuminata subsp. malaccensis]